MKDDSCYYVIMTNKTQTEELQLEIRIDGELVTPSLAETVGSAALDLTQAAGRAFTHYLGNVATNIREDVSLGVFDALHGTDLYKRKYDELERRTIARKAAQHAIKL